MPDPNDSHGARPESPSKSGGAAVGAKRGLPLAGSVRNALILVHSGKPEAVELGREIEPYLAQRIEGVRVEPDVVAFAQSRAGKRSSEGPNPDLVVVLGGDGAILSAVRAFAAHPVPTLGINFGRVGFLASTPVTRWRETLDDVLEGRGVMEPRMRLSVRFGNGRSRFRGVALNDVVVTRRPDAPMLRLGLEVGDDWVTDYRADGLIVATPSGSTAYALSAGGPILAPSMLGIVATPLASQGLSARPIVLHPDSRVSVRMLNENASADVVVDGQRVGSLDPGEVIHLQRHARPYPLLAMPGLDPYRRLRERLGWSGSVGGHDAKGP